MSKRAGAAIGIVLAVGGLALLKGRDMVDLFYLDRGFKRLTQLESDHEPGAYLLSQACTTCHGIAGNSRSSLYPSLAGLPATYVVAQLNAFASQQRDSAMMRPLAQSLSDKQKQMLGRYFALQKPGGARAEQVADSGAKSDLQILDSCRSCHGGRLSGGAAAMSHVPRLAGQGERYLATQLHAYKSGHRTSPSGVMTGIAQTLSDNDIELLAATLSQLPTHSQGQQVTR